MKRFKDLKVKTKLNVFFSMLSIGILIFAYMSISSITEINKRHEAVFDEYGAGASYFGMAAHNFQLMTTHAETMMAVSEQSEKEEAYAEYQTARANTLTNIASFSAVIKDEEIKTQIMAMDTDLRNYLAQLDVITEKLIREEVQDFIETEEYHNLQKQLTSINTKIDGLFTTLYVNGDKVDGDVARRSGKTTQVCTVISICMVLYNVVIWCYVVNMIYKPVKKLTSAANQLAVGDVEVTIHRESGDEYGDLAESFANMAANMREQAEVVQRVAQGDRTVVVVPHSEKDLVGNALKNMMEEENVVLSGIKEASYQVTTGSEQVASASQSLAQGSTEQASAIQQITASIEEITERTKINANDANETNKLVMEAREHAELGNARMEQMRGAMAEINDSSENISKIIKVIDDIAFQTNILALNAAVEAARAGQHGRGFAVVADEVRNLAGKSAQAASETAELIEDSIRKVTQGSALAEETAEALEKIVASIEQVVGLINSIAIASNDQATAIAQIDQAITQVSQVVQTNSATSEQCAAASEELSAQAARLRDMITRYQLKPVEYSNAIPQPTGVARAPYLAASAQKMISLEDGFGKY